MTTEPGPAPVELTIDPELSGIVRTGLVRAEPVLVEPSGPDLLAEIDALCRDLTAAHAGKAPAEISGLEPARRLYRAFGVDPTRTRPSSEALLRRVLSGRSLPRILNAVDLCNLCALRFLLPIGLYDAGRIRGAVTLRRGRTGESYEGVRKDEVHLGGRIVLADAEGPFGNPTADSMRTGVTEATRSLWMVIFAPGRFDPLQLHEDVAWSCDVMARHLAAPGARVIVSGGALPHH